MLFIDEMQNIPEWFLFANRLLRQKMRPVITGSNAKLLSGELSTHLILNIVPAKASVADFSRIFHIASDHTTRSYLSFLEQAYLLYEVKKYSTKSAERLVNAKLYPVDVALMDMRPNAFAGENLGWRLETLVHLELRRRHLPGGCDIYYWEDKTSEADFLVCKGRSVRKIVQVSYDISNPKVRKRELRGAQNAATATRCGDLTLVTYDERGDDAMPNGLPIEIVPAHEWLCRK